MENGTKLRILYLYQHLMQHTDAEHTLSTAKLMKILKEECSMEVSRNTISNDLAMLHDCGLHIEHYELRRISTIMTGTFMNCRNSRSSSMPFLLPNLLHSVRAMN